MPMVTCIVVDGELPHPRPSVTPGHEIVGEVFALGSAVARFRIGDRVSVPWLGLTCGQCKYCQVNQENLCDTAQFTGYTRDGGYAEFALTHEDCCFAIPKNYSDVEAAPLLCAGLIGLRSLKMAGEAQRLGIYGFGAAAHVVAQVAIYQGAKYSHSLVPATSPRRNLQNSSARPGREIPQLCHP